MKRIDVNGEPHLCLFAVDDIKEEEEITYDYGSDDCPWRTQVLQESHPSSLPESHTDVDGQTSNNTQQVKT